MTPQDPNSSQIQEPAGSKSNGKDNSGNTDDTPSSTPSDPSSPSPSPHTSNPTEPIDSETNEQISKSEDSKTKDSKEAIKAKIPNVNGGTSDEGARNTAVVIDNSSENAVNDPNSKGNQASSIDNPDKNSPTPAQPLANTPQADTPNPSTPATIPETLPSAPLLTKIKYHPRFDTAIVEPFINAPKNMRAYKLYNFNQLFHCLFNGQLKFNPQLFIHNDNGINYNKINTDLLRNLPDAVTLNLKATTPLCPLSITARMKLDSSTGAVKSLSFIVMVVVLSLFLMKGGYKMVIEIMNNLLYTHRLSMATLMMINFQDFGLIMFFLIKGFRNQLFLNYYLFLFFLFMFITTFFSMRIMLFTWRIKNGFININQTLTAEFRKKFFLFQLKFYFLLITYFLLMDMLVEFHPLLVLACSLILVPQIFTNLGQQIHQFDRSYILYFASPRFVIFFYMRVTNFNVEDIRPYPVLASLGLLVLIFSIVMIYFQSHYGSFFFLPRCLRWKQFNYFVKVTNLKEELLSKDFSQTGSQGSRKSFFGSMMSKIFRRRSRDSNSNANQNEVTGNNQNDSLALGERRDSENSELHVLGDEHSVSRLTEVTREDDLVISGGLSSQTSENSDLQTFETTPVEMVSKDAKKDDSGNIYIQMEGIQSSDPEKETVANPESNDEL